MKIVYKSKKIKNLLIRGYLERKIVNFAKSIPPISVKVYHLFRWKYTTYFAKSIPLLDQPKISFILS